MQRPKTRPRLLPKCSTRLGNGLRSGDHLAAHLCGIPNLKQRSRVHQRGYEMPTASRECSQGRPSSLLSVHTLSTHHPITY